MKTRKEQIDEMANIIKAEYEEWLDTTGVIPKGTTYYAECIGCAIDSAETIYNAGFSDVSEYKAEIERLKAENCELTKKLEARLTCDFVKTAQIDLLNKVKDKLDNAQNGWAYTTYIDELIEEIEKQ